MSYFASPGLAIVSNEVHRPCTKIPYFRVRPSSNSRTTRWRDGGISTKNPSKIKTCWDFAWGNNGRFALHLLLLPVVSRLASNRNFSSTPKTSCQGRYLWLKLELFFLPSSTSL